MRGIGAAVSVVSMSLLGAQAPEPITQDALREITATAVNAGGGDLGKTMNAFDKAVKAKWGSLDEYPIPLLVTEAIKAAIITPYGSFRSDLREHLRKLEPTDGVKYPDDVVIAIVPEQIVAPDIEKVVVQRDGAIVEPTENQLEPHEVKNRLGATTPLHAGQVGYPRSAFAPGANVVVTLVPAAGLSNV